MPSDLDKLRRKIQDAKAREQRPLKKTEKNPRAPNKYINLGAELVGGVIMGVGLGLFVDWLFGTSPWGLISLFILGSTAGMLNVYRALTREDNKDNIKDKNG